MVASGYKNKVFPTMALPDISSCFTSDGENAKYDASCANAENKKEEL